MPMLRSDATGMTISSVLLGETGDDDGDIRPLPLIVALPIMAAVSVGLWVLIYKLVSGMLALWG